MADQTSKRGSESERTGPLGAQPLLLLNEAGVGNFTWSAVCGPLSEQFQVLQQGQRSHVDGPIELGELGREVVTTLNDNGIERAHIAGCGLGGLIALWLAVHHPNRVARIAVIGAGLKSQGSKSWGDLAANVGNDGKQGDIVEELLGAFITPALRDRDRDLMTALSGAIRSSVSSGLKEQLYCLAQADLSDDLGRIAAPILFVCGEDDPLVSTEAMQRLSSAIPQSRFERVAQASHLAALEQPAQVAKLLLNHLGSAANLEIGFRSRRVALGDPHVDKTIAAITPFTRSFQDFLTRYCWGEVWTRSGLSRRDRSLATISALVALGVEHEIPVHVRAGLRHGLKIEEFPALYEQLALYAGLPKAFGALNATQRTLIEDGHLKANVGNQGANP